MENDLNLTTQTCFDEAQKDTIGLEQSKDALNLDKLILEYNKLPDDLKKKIKIEIDSNALQPEGKIIKLITKDKKKQKKKKLIFGYRGSEEELSCLILEWDKEIHLFFDRTLVHVLVTMLISKDLGQWEKIFHLRCTTTEFKCMMEHLSLHCTSFNPATIQKTKAFISSSGTLINASYLYNTSTEHLHNKELIAYIFRKYC